jgi:16S rRNA (guanine527-N7)-methyltransferase
MDEIQKLLIDSAEKYGIEVNAEQAESFQQYMALLLNWNEKVNLTAITQPEEVANKHFLDSILLLQYLDITDGAKLIDIGTGAGFPGVALKLMRPNMELTLLDGLNKRLVFLKDLSEKLRFSAEFVHARSEEAAKQKEYREQFDFATARAVAPLNILCEYCLPFLKLGGVFAAMKGPLPQEEVDTAKNAIHVLGCVLSDVKEFELPNGDKRSVILIERIKPLSALYPRHGSKIKKSPL